MQLPTELRQAIEREAANINTAQLAKAATELSDNYRFRQNTGAKFITSSAHCLAYVVTRMPATFAAIYRVLSEIKKLVPESEINSVLDLGAGPGTVAWAAKEIFPALQKLTMLEQDGELIRLGKSFAQQGKIAAVNNAEWVTQNITATKSFAPHDCIIASYTLGELPTAQARMLAKQAWEAATKFFVVIEPGSVKGFALIKQLREDINQMGGNILAPCPHANVCPMPENDWCHFAARVERTALHRKLKSGALSYEDEKFSYVIFAKNSVQPAPARIIRHPNIQSGFVKLQLCAQNGLQEITVTQKQKANYKKARKANWGDGWKENG